MKRSGKLLALVLVLAVCVAGYAFISGQEQEENSVTEETGSFALSDLAQEDITGLRWENDYGSFDFVKEDGTWVRRDDASFPVNQSALDSLAKKAAELTGTREITDVKDAGDYGLSEPAFSVTVSGTEGEVTYAMGDETPFGDGYYVSVTGREAIYTLSDSLATTFKKTVTQLCELETLPDVGNVTRLTVSGAIDAVCGGDGEWTDSVTGEALDADGVESLISGAKGIEWNDLVATGATDEALAAYALDDAQATVITLTDEEEGVLTLYIGGEDESGNRYARLPDSAMVYTVYADDVEDLLGAGVDTLWQSDPVRASFDTLASAELTFDGGTVRIEREMAEQTEETAGDEAGDEADDEAEADAAYAVTVNGETDEDGAAESLWKLVDALSGTKRIAYIAEGDAILTVTWTQEDGAQGSIALYSYDVDSYLLPITDTHSMLVSADKADKIIRTLKQMLAPAHP